LSEVALDELAHLAAPLSDESDHVDVGFASPCHHSEERALPHAASGEDAKALSPAARDEGVDRANAQAERGMDGVSLEGVRRAAVHRHLLFAARRRLIVDRAAQGVEDPPFQLLAHEELKLSSQG